MYAKLPVAPSVAITNEIDDVELSLIDPDLRELLPELKIEFWIYHGVPVPTSHWNVEFRFGSSKPSVWKLQHTGLYVSSAFPSPSVSCHAWSSNGKASILSSTPSPSSSMSMASHIPSESVSAVGMLSALYGSVPQINSDTFDQVSPSMSSSMASQVPSLSESSGVELGSLSSEPHRFSSSSDQPSPSASASVPWITSCQSLTVPFEDVGLTSITSTVHVPELISSKWCMLTIL